MSSVDVLERATGTIDAAVDKARFEVPRIAAQGSNSVVLELEALFARVHAITQTIDAAITRELASEDHEVTADLVVLDDIMPRYLKANRALKACDAHLGGAFAIPPKCLSDHAREGAIREPRPHVADREQNILIFYGEGLKPFLVSERG